MMDIEMEDIKNPCYYYLFIYTQCPVHIDN